MQFTVPLSYIPAPTFDLFLPSLFWIHWGVGGWLMHLFVVLTDGCIPGCSSYVLLVVITWRGCHALDLNGHRSLHILLYHQYGQTVVSPNDTEPVSQCCCSDSQPCILKARHSDKQCLCPQ